MRIMTAVTVWRGASASSPLSAARFDHRLCRNRQWLDWGPNEPCARVQETAGRLERRTARVDLGATQEYPPPLAGEILLPNGRAGRARRQGWMDIIWTQRLPLTPLLPCPQLWDRYLPAARLRTALRPPISR